MIKHLSYRFLLCIVFLACRWNDLNAQCGQSSLDAADQLYSIGRFDSCIQSLETCLNQAKSYSDLERSQAYQLIAKCYLAMDNQDQADENIKKLLLMQSNFEPYANDPIRFRQEVLYIRQVLRANLISSVSKKAENIDLAPATIQIITAQEIRNRGYQDLESVIYDLPGFDISRNFGITFSTLYQRGYRSASYTERTLLLVDGVESNEIWSNAAFISKQFPIANVKRVEVIYGPASTIYGPNAFVGVINIVTKNEGDYFPVGRNVNTGKAKNTVIHVLSGYGSLNTRYVDLNVAKKVNKDVFFSLTGRIYKSNNIDLSNYSTWNNQIQYDTSVYSKNFRILNPSKDTILKFLSKDSTHTYFNLNDDSTVLFATGLALQQAADRDRTGYNTIYNNVNTSTYKSNINDMYISGKLSFGDLKLGAEYWNKREGSIGDFVNRFASVNGDLTSWQVRQFYIYEKFDKALTSSGKLNFSNFTTYRGTDFGDNSQTTLYKSYGNKSLSFYDFISNKKPSFSTTYFSQISSQFKSEFKLQYKLNEKIDFNNGAEFRTGNVQGDYVKGSTDTAIKNGTVTNGSTLPGGNNFTPYTIGAYTQLNYQDIEHHLNVSLAYRWDYNRFRKTAGYGSIFNPRVAIVYYPGKQTIFKAIYAEAFMDASSFNKFSSSATRLANNPTLEPEKVRNIELSAQYNFKKSSSESFVQLAFYKAYYNNTLALFKYTMPNGVVTNRFDAGGKANISGLQLSAKYRFNHFSFYANATYTDPKVTFLGINKTDSVTKRTGDIADYSANLGVDITPLADDRLNVNIRLNRVGDKPTGINTSITENPLSNIDGFTIVHLNVGYQLREWVRIQSGCTNLFNKEYFTPGVRAADNIQNAPISAQYRRMFQLQLLFNIIK